ncbi:hypothetical protein A4R26_04675 [Niastella populi]|uniref:Uncharacterized protein n=2 Tax=Niastella populi TaxID=550983 RepID=A0A1V9FDK0_9BACT|nr:hypothetical protein A4R26_04675 [Niastella populi]
MFCKLKKQGYTILIFSAKRFDAEFNRTVNSLDTFMNVWYSKNLAAMKEPILADCEEDIEIYRFTWLRTFHNPIMIRVQKVESNFTLTVKRLSGQSGYEPGQIIMNKTFKIKETEWDEIQSKLKQINFYQLNAENDFRGFDGAEWILEDATQNNYHFTTRWSPGKTGGYAKCCLYFLKLSRIKITENEIY